MWDIYSTLLKTEITKDGSRLIAKEYVEKREKLTRNQRWEQLDEEVTYLASNWIKKGNPSQIRNVIRQVKLSLAKSFSNRQESA